MTIDGVPVWYVIMFWYPFGAIVFGAIIVGKDEQMRGRHVVAMALWPFLFAMMPVAIVGFLIYEVCKAFKRGW